MLKCVLRKACVSFLAKIFWLKYNKTGVWSNEEAEIC